MKLVVYSHAGGWVGGRGVEVISLNKKKTHPVEKGEKCKYRFSQLFLYEFG